MLRGAEKGSGGLVGGERATTANDQYIRRWRGGVSGGGWVFFAYGWGRLYLL